MGTRRYLHSIDLFRFLDFWGITEQSAANENENDDKVWEAVQKNPQKITLVCFEIALQEMWFCSGTENLFENKCYGSTF